MPASVPSPQRPAPKITAAAPVPPPPVYFPPQVPAVPAEPSYDELEMVPSADEAQQPVYAPEELGGAPVLEPLPEEMPAAVIARPALSLPEALAAISQATTREAIGEALVDALRSTFGCGLALIVRDQMALGWKGFAVGVGEEALEALAIPLAGPSVFRLTLDRKTIFRGAPPDEGALLHGRMWKLLHASPPEEVIVAPVLLKDRVVLLLYAHAIDGGVLPDTAMSDLSGLCASAATAFARLIQSGKRRSG